MDRKEFIRKGLMGTGMVAANATIGKIIADAPEKKEQETVGFNHLPNTKSEIMENTILHKADTRGVANHGWLKSYHTFSFANYHNPERTNFGVLRVLNDDAVAAGMGFGKHPHDNMEIISIPLSGDLQHEDSMGNKAVIKKGEIQVMSAGTGVAHSEYNKNRDAEVKFLQIWVFPNKRNVQPRYDQIKIDETVRNQWQQILSPNPDDAGVWIHQDAWFHIGRLDNTTSLEYKVKKEGNGVYIFVLEGSAEVNGQQLDRRDGLGVWNTDGFQLTAIGEAEILLMEVPMKLDK